MGNDVLQEYRVWHETYMQSSEEQKQLKSLYSFKEYANKSFTVILIPTAEIQDWKLP